LRKVKVFRHKPEEAGVVRYVRVNGTAQCRVINGEWCWVTLKPLPDEFHWRQCRDVDVILNRPVSQLSRTELRRIYGAEVFAIAVRRMTQRELQQSPVPHAWWNPKRI
jgi:hypothetical protein